MAQEFSHKALLLVTDIDNEMRDALAKSQALSDALKTAEEAHTYAGNCISCRPDPDR